MLVLAVILQAIALPTTYFNVRSYADYSLAALTMMRLLVGLNPCKMEIMHSFITRAMSDFDEPMLSSAHNLQKLNLF